MQQVNSATSVERTAAERVPEARYAYYRRCQVFRRNGAQCKAPAEKGSQICHAHAGQLAMAVRRERDRRAVLAEAVTEMRRRGRPDCEMADLFTDFKGIQVTTAVMARAVIKGTIDCKTAGQMVVHLQTMSKLLWVYHRAHRGTQREKALTTKVMKKHEVLLQICANERRLGKSKARKDLPLINTDNTDLKKLPKAKTLPRINADERGLSKPKELTPLLMATPRNVYRERAPDSKGTKVLPFEVMSFRDGCRSHGPPESKAA